MIDIALHDPVFAGIGLFTVALLLVVTVTAIACAFMRGASDRRCRHRRTATYRTP